MKITVAGAGYVGLVSAACFADFGHEVTCVDTDLGKIERLSEGKVPIYEPGLEALVRENLAKRRLSFTTDWSRCVPDAAAVFIAVGTPSSSENGAADMTYVYEAGRMLAPHLRQFTVIVNKSTVPVGSARRLGEVISEVNPRADFEVASNPEFLREGSALLEFAQPDRVVIGVMSSRSQEVLQRIYEPLRAKNVPFLVTTPESAELIKYASNAFLAVKISFINEMANLCEAIGADVGDLAKGMGLDHRIGPKFLQAGPGFGGSCFPKDTRALVHLAKERREPTRITEAVLAVNEAQKERMVRKILAALNTEENGRASGKTLAVLGLTFKPETDDMRDAPSLTILPALRARGVAIRAHDPVGEEEARKVLPDLVYCKDPYQACEGADAVCLMTEWDVYRQLDLKRLRGVLRSPVFVDLRNVYHPQQMLDLGFRYISVGRPEADLEDLTGTKRL
jgi:UDPglucose 6-dehydrogenase